MKWEALPLADRARLMAAAVKNGYTDIRSIKEAYANFQNQKESTGNRFAKGGDTDDTYEPEVINPLDNLPEWKALKNIDYVAIPDPEFTREKTGAGSIEYFPAEESEGITYTNGYHRDHPMPGKDVILYNPNDNDEQDIRLDALHIMPKDSTYDALNTIYRNASWDARDDNYINAINEYTTDKIKQAIRYTVDRTTGKDTNDRYYGTDPFMQYFNNEADGTLRSLLMEGDEDYRKSKRYWSNKDEVREWNAHLMPYVNDIQRYLETGERPPRVLPNLEVTNQNAYGGNLYGYAGQLQIKSKKSQRPQWSNSYTSMIKHNEGWSPTPYADGTDVSVGYGFYRKGMGGKYVPSEVWAGKRKLTPEEGERILGAITNDLKRQLKGVLGEQLYNSLTPGQLMGYLDTGYQRPASMVAAAKAHRQSGPQAAEALLGVRGFSNRNAARRAAFSNNWDNWETASFSKDILPIQNVTWADYQAKNQPVAWNPLQLTPQEEALLNSTPNTMFNVNYTDWDNPSNSKTFEEAYAPFALDESLYKQDNLVDAWNRYTALQNLGSSSSQESDPLSFALNLSAISPKATSDKQTMDAMDQFLAVTSGGFDGINFAAYGGKVNRFDDGGLYNDRFMDYYGYRWVPASQILMSDPYFKDIQKHNPNGYYAVDEEGYYIPASTLKQKWERYKSNPSINTPSTAIPLNEVVHTFNDNDQYAIDTAKKLWGDDRFYAYRDMSNRNSDFFYETFDQLDTDEPQHILTDFSPNELIARIDTLTQHSTTPKLVTNPFVTSFGEKMDSDGRLRAFTIPEAPGAPIFLDSRGMNFLTDYVSELAHTYQHRQSDNNLQGINLMGQNPSLPMIADNGKRYWLPYDKSYYIPGTDEYNAHTQIEPELRYYLTNQNSTYNDFVNSLKQQWFPDSVPAVLIDKKILQEQLRMAREQIKQANSSTMSPATIGGQYGSAINKFGDGGLYDNKFMDYYGYKWVPASQIPQSDPYYNNIQKHNPNGNYAVDENGHYVPVSVLKSKWNEYNSLPEERVYQRAIGLTTPYSNYEDAIDMEDGVMLRLKQALDKGVSNCTLTASQLFDRNRPIGRARTIVSDPIANGFYEVDEDHIVPGTMVIASHPEIDDADPNQKYHTMIITGYADNDKTYTFRDGTEYEIKKGEPLVSYSRGKRSSDNYVKNIPLSVYNDKSEGKTYNRYYRPIDQRYPEVMLDNIEITPKKH